MLPSVRREDTEEALAHGETSCGEQAGDQQASPRRHGPSPITETQACGQQGRRGGPASTGLTSHSGWVEKLPPNQVLLQCLSPLPVLPLLLKNRLTYSHIPSFGFIAVPISALHLGLWRPQF